MKKNNFKNCTAVLWLNKGNDELVLVARGSGENLYEGEDVGLIDKPAKFLGMDGKKLWRKFNRNEDNIYDFAARMEKKLAKKFPDEINDSDDIECAWDDWCDENTAEFDCETYSMIFDLDSMEDGDAVRAAVTDPEHHTFDVYPTGFSIDGKSYDESEAMADGGLQTTFEKSTPGVYTYKQLAESLGMCGVAFGEMKTAERIKYAKEHYHVVAGVV